MKALLTLQEFGRVNADNSVTFLKLFWRRLTALGSGIRLSYMGRFGLLFSTAIGCWALVAMPALCTGGVLLHPCDCGHADECRHESECATDPCGTVVTRPNDGHELTIELHSYSIASALPILHFDQRVLTPITWSSPPSDLARAGVLDALTSTILLI